MGADTELRGSVRVPSGFSSAKPSSAKPCGLCPLGFAASGLPSENPMGALTLPLAQCWHPQHSPLRGQFFHTAPRIFNSFFQSVMVDPNLLIVSRFMVDCPGFPNCPGCSDCPDCPDCLDFLDCSNPNCPDFSYCPDTALATRVLLIKPLGLTQALECFLSPAYSS